MNGTGNLPSTRGWGGVPRGGREAAKAPFMSFPFLLLEGFGAAFAKVVEMDEADGVGFEEILGGGALRGETGVVRGGGRWCSRRIGGRGIGGSHVHRSLGWLGGGVIQVLLWGNS